MPTMTWTCARCRRPAGERDEAREFGDQIVCPRCYRELTAQAAREAPPAPPEPAPAPILPYTPARPKSRGRLTWWAVAVLIGLGLVLLGGMVQLTFPATRSAGPVVLGGLLWVVGLLIILVEIWLLPYHIAKGRDHPEAFAVGVLSFAFGWTLIGWLGAMVWAVAEQPGRGREE